MTYEQFSTAVLNYYGWAFHIRDKYDLLIVELRDGIAKAEATITEAGVAASKLPTLRDWLARAEAEASEIPYAPDNER
jgi:hypothetical protein